MTGIIKFKNIDLDSYKGLPTKPVYNQIYPINNAKPITSEQLDLAADELMKMGSTIGISILSLGEGIASFFANNIIGYASIFGGGDAAIGFVNNINESWSSLFKESGVLSWINNKSDLKYGDDNYQTISGLGHVGGVGLTRYACEFIPVPILGECLANAVTLGDGMGSGYKFSRESGIDDIHSRMIGAGYGAIQSLSFGFDGQDINAVVGFSVPILESLAKTFTDSNTSFEDFYNNFISNYNERGGLVTSIASAAMYSFNAKAGLINKNAGVVEVNKTLFKEFQNNPGTFDVLKNGAVKVFDTPFVTTVFNYIVDNFTKFLGINKAVN